jgi:hypothetical protein
MDYGRVVKVITGDDMAFYIVAEKDGGKAAAILAAQVEFGSQIEPLGRASRELLGALGLSRGEFRKA